MRGVLVLLAALFFATPVAADEPIRPDGTCEGPTRWPICSPAEVAELYQTFGISPDRALTGPGPDTVRVLLRNGAGEPEMMFEARRNGDSGARGLVRAARYGRPATLTLGAPFVSPDGWSAFAKLVQQAVDLPPVTTSRANPDEVCVNPATVFIEVRIEGRRIIRFREACADMPMVYDALEPLAEVARVLPSCAAANERNRYPDSQALVHACLTMAGRDPVAEAAVLNRLAGPEFGEGWWEDKPAPVFTADAVLEWAGTRISGAAKAEARLQAQLDDGLGRWTWVDKVEGGGQEVVVAGRCGYRDDEGRGFEAHFAQVWVRDPSGAWLMRKWTIGRYVRVGRLRG